MLFLKTKSAKRVNSVHLIILWFCRIFGLTFGGLVIKGNSGFFVNKILKIYGNIVTIMIIIFEIYRRIEFRDELDFVYKSNFKIFYYILILIHALSSVNMILNLFYIQFKGFDLCKLWLSYPLEKLRNKIIVIIIFFTVISSHLIILFFITPFFANILNFSLTFIKILYSLIGSMLIKTMTWCKS
jgi:hypothetical protein